MVKFAVVYLFVLMAFSFAFHALFQVSQSAADTYPTPFYTLFLMFNMMIGMEYVFEDGTLEGNLKAEGRSALTLKIFYIIYMLLATIVLLNLLIAMMNDSYQAILQRSQMAWRIESVKLGVDLEKSIPFTFQAFSKVRLFNGFICKSDSTHNVRRWYMEVPTLHATHHLQGDDDTDKGMFTELRSKVDNIEVRMSEQMQQLRTSVEEVHSALRAVERALDGKPRAQAATEVGKEQKT
ncbi:transient receptor potential cation channel subfamily V member 6 [Aplysia californica]|uniref:Transient receptor potential cation channel subfamily V member 6 n=1 Tax=Aplysia californica TaxID=6500 RepID=A0ABM0ZWC8_APLCA|nr:transient receptor potential cation channel subfamily V member 6 [Aplysia californica]